MFIILWIWWLRTLSDPFYMPTDLLTIGLTVAPILLTIVVVQVRRSLAGSLAGERERGVLQLLLTTAVSPREIVLSLNGKLSQVGMILLAGVPLLGAPGRVERAHRA